MLPKVRTRQCRFPTINRGRETALPCPPSHRDGVVPRKLRLFESRETALPCPPLLRLKKPGFLSNLWLRRSIIVKKPGFWNPMRKS